MDKPKRSLRKAAITAQKAFIDRYSDDSEEEDEYQVQAMPKKRAKVIEQEDAYETPQEFDDDSENIEPAEPLLVTRFKGQKYPVKDAIDEDPVEVIFPQTECPSDLESIPVTLEYFEDADGQADYSLLKIYSHVTHKGQINYCNIDVNQGEMVECFPRAVYTLEVVRPQIDMEQTCYKTHRRDHWNGASFDVAYTEVIKIQHPDSMKIKGALADFDDLYEKKMYKYLAVKAKIDASNEPNMAHLTPYAVGQYQQSTNIVKSVTAKFEFYTAKNQTMSSHLNCSVKMAEFMKFYVSKENGEYKLDVFLKLDVVKQALINLKPLHLVTDFMTNRSRTLRPSINLNQFEIPDTNSNIPCEPLEGFGLELRGYQKRTLSWLQDLENNPENSKINIQIRDMNEREQAEYDFCGTFIYQVGNDGLYFNRLDNKFYLSNQLQRYPMIDKSVKCNGAILADDTGTGKTVTVLALVHTNPFKSIRNINWTLREAQTMIPSRASLVICPSHLAQQWKAEAMRVMPDARILMLTTINDHKKITWNDIQFADLVITTLNFLQNKNYELMKATVLSSSGYNNIQTYMADLKLRGRAHYGNEKGKVLFERIYWHRLISDEFHELNVTSKTKKAAKFFLNELQGRFYLGVTGTPRYNKVEQVVEMASYLNTKISTHVEAIQFLKQRCRRNEPQLTLPPLTQELRWVQLSAQERGLYFSNGESVQSLMACNHHQLAEQIVQMVGEQNLSVEEVSRKVQTSRLQQISGLRQHVASLTESCDKLQVNREKLRLRRLKGEVYDGSGEKKKSIAELITGLDRQIETNNRHQDETVASIHNIQGQYNFFQAVLQAVANEVEQACLICLEDIHKGDEFCVTRCGHIYCIQCIEKLTETHRPVCGMCREPITREGIARMSLTKDSGKKKNDDTAGENEFDDVDWSKYGSKLAEVTRYLKTLFAKDSQEKVILFIQFRRLTKLVGAALKEFGIEHVSCEGNILSRSKAIKEFKNNKNVRMILLSSDDSVSGLHLIEATTVVILHPFLVGSQRGQQVMDNNSSDALCMSYEKQGVARAWRGGQTHPIRLVRFLVRDTIEETLAVRRKYKDGEITNMEYM